MPVALTPSATASQIEANAAMIALLRETRVIQDDDVSDETAVWLINWLKENEIDPLNESGQATVRFAYGTIVLLPHDFVRAAYRSGLIAPGGVQFQQLVRANKDKYRSEDIGNTLCLADVQWRLNQEDSWKQMVGQAHYLTHYERDMTISPDVLPSVHAQPTPSWLFYPDELLRQRAEIDAIRRAIDVIGSVLPIRCSLANSVSIMETAEADQAFGAYAQRRKQLIPAGSPK